MRADVKPEQWVYVNGALISIDRQLPKRSRSHPGWHVLGGLLVLFWAVVLWMMFKSPTAAGGVTQLSSDDLAGVLADEEEWLGAYSEGRKLGYVRSRIRRSEETFTIEQDTFLKMRLGGIREEITSRFSADLGNDFRLRGFEFQFRSGLLSARAEGRMQENRLVVKAQIGSETHRVALPLDAAPLFDLTVLKILASRELRAGERYRVQVFDPQTLSNRPVEIEVVGLEVVKVQGGMEPAIHLRRTIANQPVDTWIDARGAVLMEKTSFGLMLRREDPETARMLPEDDGLTTEVDATELLRLFAPDSPGVREEK